MSDAKQEFIDEVMRLAQLLAEAGVDAAVNHRFNKDSLPSAVEKISSRRKELRAFMQELIDEPVATTCFPDPDDERDEVRFSLADWARLNKLLSGTKLYSLDGGCKDE